MVWDWLSFVIGVLVGLALMWIAAVVSMLGDQREQEER
jgi:hypothetical protein